MSQYPYPPPPYSPPTVDPSAWTHHASSNPQSRAAALWQFIFGSFVLLAGTCFGTAIWVLPGDLLTQSMHQQQVSLPPMRDFSFLQEIRLVFSVFSAMTLLAGGLLLLLAVFVRRGGKASAIFSIIVNSLIGLFVGINVLSGLIQAVSNPAMILPLLFVVAILGLCIVVIAKLAIALKSTGSAEAQAAQHAYYWMMQQQAAGYGTAGYGQSGYGPVGYANQGGYPAPQIPPPPIAALPIPDDDSAALPAEDGPLPQPPSIPSDREK